jgi:AGCS family alanine or glycine:cation symporter
VETDGCLRGFWHYANCIPFRECDSSEIYSSVRTDSSQVIVIEIGKPQLAAKAPIQFSWHEVAVEGFFIDKERQQPFSGKLYPERQLAIATDGTSYDTLYGLAMENAAPLTQLVDTKALGSWGTMLVLLCVFLFGISTSISWCYYGDRCVNYLFGAKMILPYKAVYVIMHFVGAVTSLNTIWGLGDTVLAFITIPNVLALLLLSGVAKKLTDEYFEKIDGIEKE